MKMKIKKKELHNVAILYRLNQRYFENLYHDHTDRAGIFDKLMSYGKNLSEAYANLHSLSTELRNHTYTILIFFEEKKQKETLYEVPACTKMFKDKHHCYRVLSGHCLRTNSTVTEMLRYIDLLQEIKDYFKEDFEEISNYFLL